MLSLLRSPRRTARATAAALILLATLLTSAGCGGDSGSASSSGDAALALGLQAPVTSFDPAQLNTGESQYVWGSVYDTLIYADDEGNLKPNAAEKWTYSADRRTLTITLRKGMTFSSGTAVNAAAVKATLEHIEKVPGPQLGAALNIASVEAPDQSTVVITLKQADAEFLYQLSAGLGVIADPASLGKADLALNPVGSGPYTLDKAATVNGSTYVLKRRAGYWNENSYPFKAITFRVISDPTATVNALRSGQLNASSVDTRQSAGLKAAGFDITPVDATAIASVILADRSGQVLKPLGDLRVRQAINMAFDRAKMVEKLLNGAGKPTVEVFNPHGDAYDPALESTYSYDPAAAKKLLAQAGYPNGFSVTMPSFVYTQSFEPTIGQALAAIGIKVTWKAVPLQNVFTQIAQRQYPIYLFLSGMGTAPGELKSNAGPTGGSNPFASTDPKLTALLSQINTAEPAQAAPLYKQANAIIVKDAWEAPLFFIGTDWVTKGVKYVGAGKQYIASVRQFDTVG